MGGTIDPKAAEFRKLRFDSLDQLLAEVDRIVAAEKTGKLRRAGNWTTGQVFSHLGAWCEYGQTGYPFPKPPFFIRWMLGFMVKKYLRNGMPRGVRIPGAADGTYGTEPASIDAGAARLKAAIQKLKNREPMPHESPAFGPMSYDDRIALNLRHAELHLGYLHY